MPKFLPNVDRILFIPAIVLVLCGIATVWNVGQDNGFALRQIMWLVVALGAGIGASYIDVRTLAQTRIALIMYSGVCALLVAVLVFGSTIKGATSWFQFGGVSFQPSDIAKIVLIVILAKYLSRRHVEIGRGRHLLITGLYMAIPTFLVMMQPDFGTTVILGFLWLGMIVLAGASRKHLAVLGIMGVVGFFGLWFFVFQPYQKARIETFVSPLSDIHGSGYNAYQSVIAIGSGGLTGKGWDNGTQSRLGYLPEYETDFIFAAFSEEWGLLGSIVVILLLCTIIGRLFYIAARAPTTIEGLAIAGIALWFLAHMIINVGMNMGVAPVTGLTLPFLSYGGSHLLAEFFALGLAARVARHIRAAHASEYTREYLGFGT
jgi:rod shape determining protein RodA